MEPSLLNDSALLKNGSAAEDEDNYYYYFDEKNGSAAIASLFLNAKLIADEARREAYVEFAVEGVALTVVSCLGLIGNATSFLALANVHLGSFANLLR